MSRAVVEQGIVGQRERVGTTASSSLQTINGLGIRAQFGMAQADPNVGLNVAQPLYSKNNEVINTKTTITRIIGPISAATGNRVSIDWAAYKTHSMGAPMFMRIPSPDEHGSNALRNQSYSELYSVPMLAEVAGDFDYTGDENDYEAMQDHVNEFFERYRFDGLANIMSGQAVRSKSEKDLTAMSVVVHGPMETGDFYSGDTSGISSAYVGIRLEKCSYDSPVWTCVGTKKRRAAVPDQIQRAKQTMYCLKIEPFATSKHPIQYMQDTYDKVKIRGQDHPVPCRAWRIGTIIGPSNRSSSPYGLKGYKRKRVDEPYKRAWHNVHAFPDLPKMVVIVHQIDPYWMPYMNVSRSTTPPVDSLTSPNPPVTKSVL